jgi:hypothetical protein
MIRIRVRKVLWLFLGVFLLISVFPVSGFAEQKGDIVYVTFYPMFYHTGGDAVTHFAGQGPFLATTIFEGLVDTAVDLSAIPAAAKSWTIGPGWS